VAYILGTLYVFPAEIDFGAF